MGLSVTLKIVDEISRQFGVKGGQQVTPDPRWHNLIYPIRCCENYLRARVVPHMTARFLLEECDVRILRKDLLRLSESPRP